jgi:hypothetical protein
MLKIEVTSETAVIKSPKGEFTKQIGYAFLPASKYPRKISFMPPKRGELYPPGYYTIAPESFDVGQYDRLEVSRMVLTPISAK